MDASHREAINAALSRYGARLTADDRIARGDKVLGIRAEISKGRLRMVAADSGALLASYPATKAAAGVANFVEKFWYWKPEQAGSRRRGARRNSRGRFTRSR